jgi:hypothetical protein
MRILSFILLFAISLHGYSQNASPSMFRTAKADTLETKLKSIIMLSIGSMATQILLDNLSEKMIRAFKGRHVTMEYRYLGKTNEDARVDTVLDYAKKFDAVLLFRESDSSFSELYDHYDYLYTPVTGFGMTGQRLSTPVVLFIEKFHVRLFSHAPDRKFIWAADLEIDQSVTKKTYKIIANSFVNRFKKHKYIE